MIVMDERYKTISARVTAEIEEKKSRFIANLAPVQTEEQAVELIQELRSEHRMARHTVYAYVLREGNRVRYSDDGEPSKTAGLPVLGVLQHEGLYDVIAIVTRYFGGTLLGTGGLVRAYTQATQAALEQARILVYARCVKVDVSLPYALYDRLNHHVQKEKIEVFSSRFTEDVALQLVVKESQLEVFLRDLQDLLREQGSFTVGESFDAPLPYDDI